ncbi:MAG TPA: hypothetical protein VHU23_12510 [Rhizomicrobium sp.]|jgi:hypothetical protein|nr:hypothetical protein [Rhizomicrobium sp.]
MRYVVEIELDRDPLDVTAKQYKAYLSLDDAARQFNLVRAAYRDVAPLGPDGKLNIIGGKIYASTASDESTAIEEVRSGSVRPFNDVKIEDLIPAAR